jgi:hypothetical protein
MRREDYLSIIGWGLLADLAEEACEAHVGNGGAKRDEVESTREQDRIRCRNKAESAFAIAGEGDEDSTRQTACFVARAFTSVNRQRVPSG